MCLICDIDALPITAAKDIPIVKVCCVYADGKVTGYYRRNFEYQLQRKTPEVQLVKREIYGCAAARINEGYYAFSQSDGSIRLQKTACHFTDKNINFAHTLSLSPEAGINFKVFEGYIPKGTKFYKEGMEIVAESIVLTGLYDFTLLGALS